MIFGLSLGSIHKLIQNDNKNEAITFIRKTLKNKVNAIEILISKNNLKDFKLSNENYEWLSKLPHLSFHLTGDFDIDYEIIKLLPAFNNIVCHINNKNKIPEWFKNQFFDEIYYENINDTVTDNNFTDITDICFDVCHALKFGLGFFIEFVIKNISYFKEIHLSNYISKNYYHTGFYKKSPELFRYIKSFFDMTKYPIIVESIFESEKEMKAEINFLLKELR
jgi:hypothetical protein